MTGLRLFFQKQGLAGLLLLFFAAQGAYLISYTSPTTDEVPFHIVNGYVYLKTGDFRMSPANTALVKEWMGLSWLPIHPKMNLDKDSWRRADSDPFGRDFLYNDNRAIAEKLVTAARSMILILGILLGAVIYAWSSRLYGVPGGLTSLAFYAFCPLFLGHSAIGTIDVGAAFFSCLSIFLFWRYLVTQTPARLVMFWLGAGLMFAAKTNTLFFVPIFAGILVYRKGARKAFLTLLGMAAVSFVVIWATYLFEFKPLLAGGVPRVDEKLGFIEEICKVVVLGNPAATQLLKKWALELPIPMPTYFLSIAGIARHHSQAYLHYSFGRYTTEAVWFQYPFLFLTKLTIPFLLAVAWRLIRFRREPLTRTDNLVLAVPFFSYAVFMLLERTYCGFRYFFPALPLLFVWIGGITKTNRPLVKYGVISLLVLNAVVALKAFPNELSYFNAFIGSENAHRYVRDSDVDWGQGLKALSAWMKQHGVERVTLDYFGTADPSYYGVVAERWTETEIKAPLGKVYALSRQYLDHAPWALERKPAAVVGGSIHVYDLR